MQERRFLDRQELRSADARHISGYAAVFSVLSQPIGNFRETILPGAFDGVLDGDTVALYNHNMSLLPLGRTTAGTLTLASDKVGLWFDAALPDTEFARALALSVKRGDLKSASFAFSVLPTGQNWTQKNGQAIRELVRIDRLYDVSVVQEPSYSQTSIQARAQFPDGTPPEIRSRPGWTEPTLGLYTFSSLPSDNEMASVYAGLTLRLKRLL
jgi:HK97 family phage prohead protease